MNWSGFFYISHEANGNPWAYNKKVILLNLYCDICNHSFVEWHCIPKVVQHNHSEPSAYIAMQTQPIILSFIFDLYWINIFLEFTWYLNQTYQWVVLFQRICNISGYIWYPSLSTYNKVLLYSVSIYNIIYTFSHHFSSWDLASM